MNEVVTISKSEYEKLLVAKENYEDLLAVKEYKSNPQESVSSEFVKRMMEGEALLKLWREHRGLTQVALSNASGVNRVQIADIESGGKTGSVTTLKKLADALSINIDDLV